MLIRAATTLPTLPSLPPVFAIDELRDLLNDLLLDLRTVAVLALGSSFLLAVCCGVLFGDNSSPLDELGRGKGQETTRPTGAERTFLASRFSSARARDYDRGVDAPPPSGERRAASAPQRSERAPPVSAAMWFELALCVAVDACGSASLYFPAFGEVSDAGFAVLNAFVIELLFDWPELAAFAFWEELLPFSDFLPTATIGWALVVTGTRTRLTRADSRRRDHKGIPARHELRLVEHIQIHVLKHRAQPANRGHDSRRGEERRVQVRDDQGARGHEE